MEAIIIRLDPTVNSLLRERGDLIPDIVRGVPGALDRFNALAEEITRRTFSKPSVSRRVVSSPTPHTN